MFVLALPRKERSESARGGELEGRERGNRGFLEVKAGLQCFVDEHSIITTKTVET
jgi:hypothetical protein